MKRKFVIGIDGSGAEKAIRGIRTFRTWLEKKTALLVDGAAKLGMEVASVSYQAADYTGPKRFHVDVRDDGERIKAVVATGQSVLFLEFGAGVTYGYGHPEAGTHDMGPGTWPYPHYQTINGEQVQNWKSPYGWYLPDALGGEHTYGNAPSMGMYQARKEITEKLSELVAEVFRDD